MQGSWGHGLSLPQRERERERDVCCRTQTFATLQKLVKLNLVVPVDEDHMYYAAMNSKSCRLTVLGEHYWRLIDRKRI